MKASILNTWPSNMKPHEWPKGTLQHMSAGLFTDCIFPLRVVSGVPMSPSPLFEAHVRSDNSNSRHNVKNDRLSDATDMQVSTVKRMLKVMIAAETINAIGGIGIYFDTHKPTIHIDQRKIRLVWLAYKENGKRVYLYRENDPVKFYIKLGELLS